ncbi:MAG: helix-turn-helix domain-containing protein [Phenylobacterium sp.]|uniref:helix-turn-helix transcriptional regulator n=1 Tax=Phenylobacterium sp. TaxID=1871053 RepID=UPI0025F6AAB9|nr:helix-turn-helix domain-containing protein [Phenylobacterium sp.]MCG9915439.1 helix-turn-helix domain-containing protein [Phenylobacterium sp.]
MSVSNDPRPASQGQFLLTVEEAAERLRLSVSILNKWRVSGDGPPYLKLGRRVLYGRDQIDAWVSASSRRSTSEIGQRNGERA